MFMHIRNVDVVPIENGLKQGDTLLPLLFNLFQQCHMEDLRESEGTGIEWDNIWYMVLIYFAKMPQRETEEFIRRL
jgi:hypothetical protein